MSIDMQPTTPTVPAKPRRRWILTTTIALATLIIGIAIGSSGDTPTPTTPAVIDTDMNGLSLTRLDAAKDLCASVSAHVVIGDNGMTMTVDRVAAEDNPGAHIEQLDCILAALDTPHAVIFHMDSTRALDGMQADEWDGFHATWTYHPDDGINLIIEDALAE
jgi:hypothetical protein